MEMPQGNSCVSDLNKQKWHFVFYKNREQEGRGDPAWEDGASGGGEGVGE
jgi:hypothetical protein